MGPDDEYNTTTEGYLSPFTPPAGGPGGQGWRDEPEWEDGPFAVAEDLEQMDETRDGELEDEQLEDEQLEDEQLEDQQLESEDFEDQQFEDEQGAAAEWEPTSEDFGDWGQGEGELEGTEEAGDFEMEGSLGVASFAAESLADEQSLAEESGEDEAARGSVGYPSGQSLPAVAGPDASASDEYWDPNQTGVALVDTSAAQAGKRLSSNFTVAELARSGSHRFDKARIDPGLVRCLQALRDSVGKAVRVNSGYRSWGYNQQLYRGRNRDATLSRHCSGQAADIAIAGMTGLEVAKAAIEACGGDIGVGIDRRYAHIDVRGTWARWTYPGLGGASARRRAVEEIDQYRAARSRQMLVGAARESEVEAGDEQESFLETIGRLLAPGPLVQRVRELLGEGLFGMSLLARFGAGQIWNEDHLALEILFHRQPTLRPADLDTLTGSKRLGRLSALAIKHQRALTSIRERVVRPVFGRPSNFQIGSSTECTIQDLRAVVRAKGPIEGGKNAKGQAWFKRSDKQSPRKQASVDSIVLHHMAFNRGNDVQSYLRVGAHYIVLADGQVAQLYDDLDFMNASNGFNPRSVAIEFAGNFPTLAYQWWRDKKKQVIPDRCYLTPAEIRAGRCLVGTLKARLPGIQFIYAHRQSSKTREDDPGPDVWFNVGEWAIGALNLTDRLPQTHIDKGNPIPAEWRAARPTIVPGAVPPAPTPVKGAIVPVRPRTPVPAPRTTPSPAPSGRQVVVSVDSLNVRASPSVQGARLGSLKRGEVVDVLETSQDGRWLKVRRGSLVGWCFRDYLSAKAASGPLDRILQLAAASDVARYSWKDRGRAPIGYIKGMAVVYARVYCKLKAGDAAATEMAKASTGDAFRDALAHYAQEFKALGMRNDIGGADTLRHLFVLLTGLGMKESSGCFREGRDVGAKNTSADTAEAGLFQASWNLRTAHPTLLQLFKQYGANPAGFAEIFQEGMRCRHPDPKNYGTGDGVEFQRLSKASPAFAAEFAAVGLRNRRRLWGPINRKGAEVRQECDTLFLQVQKLVDEANLCPVLTV